MSATPENSAVADELKSRLNQLVSYCERRKFFSEIYLRDIVRDNREYLDSLEKTG